MRIDVVIVDYRCPTVATAIGSLSGAPLSKIRVLDNGGETHWPTLREIANRVDVSLVEYHFDGNLGFGAGCNRASADSDADYLLFLNPDAAVISWHQDDLESVLDGRVNVILGPNVVLTDSSLEASGGELPTLRSLFGRVLSGGLGAPDNGFKQAVDVGVAESRPTGWVTGACLLVGRELFHSLGGFDERYFMYYEDVDLCWRAAVRGADVERIGAITVRHERGGTPTSSVRRRVWQMRSAITLFMTNSRFRK